MRATSRPRRFILQVERLEGRELLAAALINVVPDGPGFVATGDIGQPLGFNLLQSGLSQPGSLIGLQQGAGSPGNSTALETTINGTTLQLGGLAASSSFASPFGQQALRPGQNSPLFRNNDLTNVSGQDVLTIRTPDRGYFLFGNDQSLAEGFLSDVPTRQRTPTPRSAGTDGASMYAATGADWMEAMTEAIKAELTSAVPLQKAA